MENFLGLFAKNIQERIKKNEEKFEIWKEEKKKEKYYNKKIIEGGSRLMVEIMKNSHRTNVPITTSNRNNNFHLSPYEIIKLELEQEEAKK
jgi:hypothetical protein